MMQNYRPKNEPSRPITNTYRDFEIRPKFSKTHIFSENHSIPLDLDSPCSIETQNNEHYLVNTWNPCSPDTKLIVVTLTGPNEIRRFE